MKKKRSKMLKRVVSAITAFALLFTGFPPVDINLPQLGIHFSNTLSVKAEETFATMTVDHFNAASTGTYNVTVANGIRTVTINNVAQLVEYSIAYNTFTSNNHSTDIIVLSTTSGTIWDLVGVTYSEGDDNCGGYQSIGSDTLPFKGSVQKGLTDTIRLNLDKPLFGTVEQCAEICELNLSRRTETAQTTYTPVLAQKIQNTTSASASLNLTVILAADTTDENHVISDYAGVIGSLEENTEVSLSVTNRMKFSNGTANVKSAGTVGFLCCNMGEKSSLTATINSGTNKTYTVTSTGSSAGGLVGTMDNGSKLILANAELNNITQTVTGSSYAGGIVGEATGAYIGATDPDRAIGSMTITSNLKAKATTLSATTASGYLFGSYTNAATSYDEIPADGDTPAIPASTVNDRTITIDSTFRNVSLTFNSNNAGGYFGVLDNNVTGANITFNGGITTLSSIADSSDKMINVNYNGKSNLGGVAYKYIANSLTNTLDVGNTYVYVNGNVNNFGGVCSVVDDSSSAAYINIHDFYTHQPKTAKTSGGLIYNSTSCFVDVSGYIRIKGTVQGGIVYSMPKGVLRLAGVTDLSGATSEGLIVRDRTNGLIYSKGDGKTEATWKLIRNSSRIDDVYTWGEVVRLTESGDIKSLTTDTNADYIIDESYFAINHSITVPTFNVEAISGKDDLIRLALHIQLKTGDSPTATSATGAALVMEGSSSKTILSNNITIASGSSSQISLCGTGITGLTRDNGDNEKFTGTFNGNNKTINLAIGEAYGYKSDGTNLAENTNDKNETSSGRIYRHAYNGLFARIGSGAAINNLTIGGTIHYGNSNGSFPVYIGGFGASIETGTISFTGDTSGVQIFFYGKESAAYSGGFVSQIAASDVVLNFTDCTSDVDFYDNRGDNTDNAIFYGGFVSMISNASKNVEVNFNKSSTGCILSGSYTTATDSTKTTSNIQKAIKYGGLIAYIENNDKAIRDYWNTRKININSLAINSLSIEAKVGPTSGDQNNFGCAALLGYEWYGADVTITDMSVGVGTGNKCSISLMSGSREYVKMAGLCTIATGHWRIDKLNIQGLDVSGIDSSFGMIINTAYRPKNENGMAGNYIELTNMKNYIISSDSSSVGFSGITNGYDEVAVYTYRVSDTSKNVATNGVSVISINTDANANSPSLIMTGSSCNTYQNQTAFGKTVAHNPNARYYYNLYYLRKKGEENYSSLSSAEKFLLWSVYQYAYSNNLLRAYFNNKSGGVEFISSGSLDMTGLSYYPIDYTGDIKPNDYSLIKFCNEEIELGESTGTGYTSSTGTGGIVDDDRSRTTSGTDSSHTQHYMMHCGLFRNFITAGKSFLTKNMTLEGSVGIYNGGSGFIISGTLGGANSAVNFKPNGDSKNYTVTLNGAYVYNASSAGCAPLLINNVGKYTNLHLYGIKTTDTNYVYSTKQANASWYAATSLIGKVGASDGSSTNMSLDFSKIVLDSRKTNGNLSTDSQLTTAYSTTRSIFSRATLLHWYIYKDSVSSGTYNYTYSEDWPTSGSKHQVTYGQEVKYTLDNNDDYPDYASSQQKRYSGDSTHYTDPTTNSNTSGVYDFAAAKFLPYVGDYDKKTDSSAALSLDNHNTDYHELDVNLAVASLNVGCGTYNDPYVISESGQLIALAKLLKGDTIDTKFRINLPDSDYTNLTAATGDRNLYWCTGDSNHITFYPDNGTYKRATDVTGNPSTSHTYTTDQVRMYLAGAYYQVTADLTLSSKFAGLGVGDTNNSGAYSFHGVIVGKQFTPENELAARYPIITNKSSSPLIVASNGSVIKNISISILDVNRDIAQDNPSTATFAYNGGCDSYGAVIGKIMGGDNVIDNVPVTFTNTTFTLGSGAQVVPIGGYVGVVVNGGLFFRNMSGNINGLASSSSSTTLATGVSFGDGNTGILSSKQYLYINPIIGRVINGYAVTESTSYMPEEANVTMKNNNKNYSITDILTTDTVTIDTDSITANSAQDMFILSLIVNSGTGSTASSLSYDKDAFKTTHIGTYEDVGCKQTKKKMSTDSGDNPTVCETALFASGYTELTDASATPYITVKYTNSSSNAQVITDSGKSYSISMSGTPWTMPDGFRGIGGFNSDNSSLQLGVTSVNSGGNTMIINLHSQYCTYEQTYDNYPTAASCGFGLFNTFVPATNCTVEKLTFNGQIKVTAYSSTNGSEIALATDSSRDKYLSAGMLAGVKSNANAFTLDTLTCTSSGDGVYTFQNSGGLIGDVSGAGAITVTNCAGSNLIVHSAGHSGGFFGKSGSPIRINESSGTSTVTIKSITQSNGIDSYSGNSAGGIIGYDVDSIIKNVTVSPVSGGTGIMLSSAKGGTGGLIGTSNPGVTTNAITDCTINDLTVSGTRTSAVVGQYSPSSVKTVSITNVSVDGKTGSGTNAKVERNSNSDVGTIIGYASKVNVTIENCSSKNYIIKSSGDSVGGCVGYVDESGTINLKNYLIDGCEFQSSAQATGGIIGGLGGKSSQVLGYNIAMNSITSTGTKYAADFVGSYSNKTLKIVGFSRNSTPTPSTAANYTTVCSNAVCVNSTTQTDLPSGSYIIFADYNGKGYDTSVTPNTANYSKIKQRINTGTDEDPVYSYSELITDFANAKKSPYVLINPYREIDAYTQLTGDGIADTAENLTINNILLGISGGDSKAYTYPGITFDTSHLSSFNTQLGAGTVDNDFGILVLEDTNHYNSQDLINGYLQLLTNTKYNYADRTTNAAVYSTQLYKMELVDGKFVKTGDANLKIDANNRFYMMNDKNNVDTGSTTMFSLIDIQFYDPTVASNPDVVYHLYVPVLVKKMLKYSFHLATGSGTIYDKDWYGDPDSASSRYGKILLENLGTPGTLFFTYSYERTQKEWQEALESGENLLLNYDKILNMTEVTTSLQDMAEDTTLVLVDTNQNDKCYYSVFSGASGAWANDKLCLYDSSAENASTFKTSFGSSGTVFKPVSMCELMNISVTENAASGKFVSLGDSSTGATVKVGAVYYRPYDSSVDVDDNTPSTRYNLTVVNKKGVDTQASNTTAIILTESYYLSFFTKASTAVNDSTINYYEVTAPSQLSGGAAIAKSVGLPQSALVLFGNLYEQTNMTVTANPYPSDPSKVNDSLITNTNNFVLTKLQTTVKLTEAAATNGISSKLDDSVDIYQSFVVFLTKHKDGIDTKGVVGNPAANATYKITPVNDSATYPEITPAGSQKNELNYVEATPGVSIKNYIKNTGGATITAELTLTYNTLEQRNAQFPVDTTPSGQPTDYTFVTASSNIAYDSNKTAYSKNQLSGTDTNAMKYHISSGKEASLNYNAMADDKGNPYGQLGINANDLDDNTGKVKVKTNAVYVLTEVAEDVPISTYPYVKVTFKLSQKQSRSTGYGSALQIGQYLDNVQVKGSGITTATPKKYQNDGYIDAGNTDQEYVFILNRSQLATNNDNYLLSIPIEFEVYTGETNFESKQYMYGNFRIDITAQCLKTNSSEAGAAMARNYIVYTNAKLITDFIDN